MIWKDIKNYEGLYQINKKGQVRSFPRRGTACSKIYVLTPKIDKKGYNRYNLSKNGKRTDYLAHRLVAEAFIPNPNDYPYVCHKDGSKTNNAIKNLYWGTPKMNAQDAVKHGTSLKGERNPATSLTKEDIIYIRKTAIKGESKKVLAKKFNMNLRSIYRIINKKRWAHI